MRYDIHISVHIGPWCLIRSNDQKSIEFQKYEYVVFWGCIYLSNAVLKIKIRFWVSVWPTFKSLRFEQYHGPKWGAPQKNTSQIFFKQQKKFCFIKKIGAGESSGEAWAILYEMAVFCVASCEKKFVFIIIISNFILMFLVHSTHLFLDRTYSWKKLLRDMVMWIIH